MKRTALAGVLFIATVLTVSGPAFADHIGIFSDPVSSSACVTIAAVGPVTTWVIHRFSVGALGSRWKIENNTTLMNAGWSGNGVYLGDPYVDFSVSYEGCLAGDIVLISLTHFWFGQSVTCSMIRVVAAPGFPAPLVADCSAVEKIASGGEMTFNPDDSCYWKCYDPVETSTWGKVKSLYR